MTMFHLVWDKEFEITNDTLHFIAIVKMTKEFKIMMIILLNLIWLIIK